MQQSTTPSASVHNLALDMMRALAMVLMITVNHFWTATGIPHWMHHAEATEDMLGLSDTVFPLFLFAMGMSIPYAIDNRYRRGEAERSILSHIITRSVTLLLMGAFICHSEYGIDPSLSGYDHDVYSLVMVLAFFLLWHKPSGSRPMAHRGCQIAGALMLCVLACTARNPEGGVFAAHWWGILGLIGWTYLVCGLIYFFLRTRKAALCLVLLAFLAVNVLTTPMGDIEGGQRLLALPWPNFLSEVLSVLHMDNCGLVSLGMGGVLLTVFTREWTGKLDLRRTLALLGAAVVLLVVGIASHSVFIVSKIYATAPWVLFVMSIAVALYTLLSLLVQRGWTQWFRPLAPAGTATLTCYMLPYAYYALATMWGLHMPAWLESFPIGALQCLGFSLLCVFTAYLLGKAGIKLKI